MLANWIASLTEYPNHDRSIAMAELARPEQDDVAAADRKAALALGLSLVISWKLTLFIIICAPIMASVLQKFGKKMRRASRSALQRSSSMLGQIESTLSGIRVVKGAGAERFDQAMLGNNANPP